ncbi:MAG TPA: response regulator transcription factor [Chloroflexota bacterium]|jgi:two-component system KDP operon response regulator KdpE|nr:response regulator transcription factor [Chloroflexota bacterium]
MSLAKAIVIDDEPNLVKFVGQNLRARGYEVADAPNGLEGVELVRRFKPDLIIVDLNMPGMDGFEVCSYVRHFTEAPIIMLTASGDEGDKIHALDLGADDYLTKPFGVGELMARVRAVTRRSERAGSRAHRDNAVTSGELVLDFEHHRVTRGGQVVKLTPLEFSILEELVSHPDVVVSHRQLLTAVWGAEYRDETEYLRVYMGRLRRKLEFDPAQPRHFQTEPGVGYRFTPQPAIVATGG